ncbi:MAG: DUF4402 domain-containing protein [Alphaproteobacteria bacterium]|nr:DUF4402 domain-containing protein [Alphaproteobacteria bacterium]
MRKYFLISAVALLAATNANAAPDYAEVTAKATIEVAGTFECTDMDFGTIVVKQNNKETTLVENLSESKSMGYNVDDIISISGEGYSRCTTNSSILNVSEPNITLSNASNDKLSLSVEDVGGFLGGTLIIPANVKAGEYTGSFTVTVTQE